MAYQTINPATGTLLQSFEHLSAAALEQCLTAAATCFGHWRHTAFAERAAVLNRAAVLLRERAAELAALATLEMGKRSAEAQAEVMFSADILAYYAARAEAFLAPQALQPQRGQAQLEHTPLGVLFCVEPWNFPYYQLARVAGPQLMAGNVLLVKHAGNVPQCAAAFAQLLHDAGAPAGAYTDLRVSYEQADQIIDDPRIRGVALTGSMAAGRSVAARAGRRLKPSTMELGGSDAFIVLDDADLDLAVPWAVWGRLYNAGQTCCAAKRFILMEGVAEEFTARFTTALRALRLGDPLDPQTTLGPLASEAALQQLLAQVQAATQAGATLRLGGRRIDRPGWYMQPTVLTDITPENPAYREEFFGPVAALYRVRSEAEAIALANDSPYGLGGSVWTRDEARGRRVASAIEAGMVFVNNLDWADAELPFGGIKHSGYGHELGRLGIQAFVNTKMVHVGALPAPL